MVPEYIIVHHSATKDGVVNDWQAIRRYHMSWRYQGDIITEKQAQALIAQGVHGVEKPWLDIGYHYGIELIGTQYETMVGRSPTTTGAHCLEQGMNTKSLGVCVVGNYDVDILPDPAFEKLVVLMLSLMEVWHIPKEKVKRHTDYASYKTCPGSQFPWARLIAALAQGEVANG